MALLILSPELAELAARGALAAKITPKASLAAAAVMAAKAAPAATFV
jgi:hypothetical protein